MNTFEKLTYNSSICVTFVFGVFGNAICFLVYSRKELKKISASLFFREIIFNDFFLLLHEIRHFLRSTLNFNINLISDGFCKLMKYHLFSTTSISPWLMVYVMFDRFMTIKYSKIFHFRNNLRFKCFIICSIYLFNIIFYIPVGIFEKKTKSLLNKTDVCDFNENKDLLRFMDLFNEVLIPFTLNFIFISLLILAIFQSRKRSNTRTNTKNDMIQL